MPTSDGFKARVTMLLYSDITYDNRVLREAGSLVGAGYDVTIVTPYVPRRDIPGTGGPLRIAVRTPKGTGALPGGDKPRAGGAFASLRWASDYARGLRRWGATARSEFVATDIWHAHDLTGLIALAAGRGPTPRHVIYDSHELYLDSGAMGRLPGPARRLLAAYEGRLARRASAVITVNPAAAIELQTRYAVSPTVIMNCPPLPDESATAAAPRPGPLRRGFGLGDRPVAVFHGGLSPHKGIEVMLDALPRLPSDLVLVIIGEGPLAEDVQRRATQPGYGGRLFWHPMIAPNELRSWLADADIGTILFEPDRLNHVLATPNKLTEYMNAAVPILATDIPELRRILDATGAGIVCDPLSVASISDAVTRLLDPTTAAMMRENGLAAARAQYNWETQAALLLDLYRRVLAHT